MLYLDSSALIKGYVHEVGSADVRRRFKGTQRIYTSWLTYAEVIAVLGRKLQTGQLDTSEYGKARADFERDWASIFQQIEVNDRSLARLPDLTAQHPLKAADAVHLASALWLESERRSTPQPRVEFGTADRSLARISRACGLRVFDPEAATP